MNLTEQEECVITGNTKEKNDNLLLTDITKGKMSGIYKIINKVNGKYYIGSAVHFNKRWNTHKSRLRRNVHANIHLQNAWNKYGENNFEFIIIEITPKIKLAEVEQIYLDNIKNDVSRRKKYYNISIDSKCPTLGIKPTDETRKKISDSLKGKSKAPFSENHRMNISKSHLGNKNRSFDKNIYHFKNTMTNEKFIGTRYEFYTKFGLKNQQNSISELISGIRGSVKLWTLDS